MIVINKNCWSPDTGCDYLRFFFFLVGGLYPRNEMHWVTFETINIDYRVLNWPVFILGLWRDTNPKHDNVYIMWCLNEHDHWDQSYFVQLFSQSDCLCPQTEITMHTSSNNQHTQHIKQQQQQEEQQQILQ